MNGSKRRLKYKDNMFSGKKALSEHFHYLNFNSFPFTWYTTPFFRYIEAFDEIMS